MERSPDTDIAIVGAGPAGLAAAVEAARWGARVVVLDENERPGGQLFKQIHKFFGSQAHRAGVRGLRIAEELLGQARELGVSVRLSTVVHGLFEGQVLGIISGGRTTTLSAQRIILATGASENALAFPGWELPGVMGAGAAQTMMNIHRVLPGRRVLMVGAGNVGLIVSYQLLQAGAEVAAIVEALPAIGGYEVHAAKVRRAGVPILTGHTVLRAEGVDQVERAVVAAIDAHWQPLPGSERTFEVDTICLAVGLSPLAELAWMAGCRFAYERALGGWVPVHNERMETTVPGLYVAGDLAGVEEASTAMEEGRVAGLAASASLGLVPQAQAEAEMAAFQARLAALRAGPFGEPRALAKARLAAQASRQPGAARALEASPSRQPGASAPADRPAPSPGTIIIECAQAIPCNPCETACPSGAITVGEPITNLPRIDPGRCTGCGKCIAACPGQAIFRIEPSYAPGRAAVSFPYEFLPLPRKGERWTAVGRDGQPLAEAEVLRVAMPASYDHTAVVTVAVPAEVAAEVRSVGRRADGQGSGKG